MICFVYITKKRKFLRSDWNFERELELNAKCFSKSSGYYLFSIFFMVSMCV